MIASVSRNVSKHAPQALSSYFHNTSVNTSLQNTASLLSEESRLRCLDCLQKSKLLGIKLQKDNERQKAYAAVLIAICTDIHGDASILYTRRSGLLSRHVRQISFPGGMKDSTDVDYIDCALRETEEEIGLSRSRVEIWGMGSLIRPPHTAAIMPVIGLVHNFDLGELCLNEQEVEEAFTVPLAKLTEPANLRYTQFKSGYSSPTFVVGQHRIWGITGFMTNSFLNCLIPQETNKLKNRIKYIRPFKYN